ncbi:alpha/beta hydrolase [bacterium]|nr:alpha/beta hydrolase [bacterium]
MLRPFWSSLALAALLIGSGRAEPTALKWRALQGPGYTGKLRQSEAELAGIGTVRVSLYLPPGYSQSTRYPVLYVVDGQNLFEGTTGSWELDESLEQLCQAGKMQKVIVVGIHTGQGFDRMHWFVPKQTSADGQRWEGGGASQFLEQLLQLKTKIDRDFSTNPKDSGILGSSLGGVFAEYAGFKKSEVFQHVGVLSPSAWLHQRKRQRGSEDWHPAHAPWPHFIWMDMGTHEGDEFTQGAWHESPADSARYEQAAREDASWIERQPETRSIRFRYTPFDPSPGNPDHLPARHNEGSWAVRVRQALPYLYPP